MIRSNEETSKLVMRLLTDAETEIVEFKEAKQAFKIDKLGQYFSALSNEANLRNAECGWILFGVRNDRTICGTAFYKEASTPSIGLRKLKHEIAQNTNEGITFEEIYELEIDSKRVVAFQVPPAPFAKPTTYNGIPWSREGESLAQLPKFKLDAIYSQSRPDWSRQIAYEASFEDLDKEAVEFACRQYINNYSSAQSALSELSQEDLLKKMGLIIHGHITNAALVLLGKPESAVFLGGNEPRISWTLYDSTDTTAAYQHFEPPFILQVDKVLDKIRNEKYRFFNREDTLFPEEAHRYDPEIIRELLHNAIAHQDFRLSGKINVLEYEDRLVFKNEGSFIPGTIESALESGYKPPYYRNPLLSQAMSKVGMIDQNAIGIRNIYGIQKSRFLPLPTYDLTETNRISVTIYGKTLNDSYSKLLASDPSLDLNAVFLLDMIQKNITIDKDQVKALRSRGLIEGRYPNVIISAKVAGTVGSQGEYIRRRGLDSSICKELIVELLKTKPSSRSEIVSGIKHALPEQLTEEQKTKYVGNLLQALRIERKIVSEGKRNRAVWRINE